MRLVVLLVALALLGGCASLSEDQCRSGRWDAIGFADGAEGRLESHLDKHAKACAGYGIEPDRREWLAGREQGLLRYCTPDKAYLVGRAGQRITPVCTVAALDAMQPAWEHGRMYWRLRSEISALESDRQRLRADISDIAADPDSAGERSRLFTQIRFIDLDVFRLEAQLRRYDSWPPRR